MKCFGIIGTAGVAGRGLLVRLVQEIAGRGVRVSAVKAVAPEFDVDQPGRDSHRHRAAGATEVLVSSDLRWALMHELRARPMPELDSLLARLSPVDLVLVEGFGTAPHPKLEVWDRAAGGAPACHGDPTIRAVASDDAPEGLPVPCLPLGDTAALAALILHEVRG